MEYTHVAELAAAGERTEHAFGLAFQFTGPWMQRTTLWQWQRHRRSAGATISRCAQQRSCRGQVHQRPHLSACARILRRARGRHANRMKEALVLLGRQRRAVTRPPFTKLDAAEIERITQALIDAGLLLTGDKRVAA